MKVKIAEKDKALNFVSYHFYFIEPFKSFVPVVIIHGILYFGFLVEQTVIIEMWPFRECI